MDEGDFQSDNGFDSSVMRSGIPKSMDKVDPLGEDNADLVYRNVDVMSSSSVRRAAGGDGDSAVLRRVGADRKTGPGLFQSVASAKPAAARVTGRYQVVLSEPLQAATLRVGAFLKEHSITSAHRLEAATHCWDCHTVSGSCQLVKFQIQSVQGPEGVVIDFKRQRGCIEALSNTFDKFRRESGCEGTPPRGRLRVQPPPLPDEEEEDSTDSCAAVEQALVAMSKWIQSSPIEALQSLGQLYGNKCQHLLRSENILSDVCKAVKTHETEESDIIVLTLALSCLRKILSIYSEMGSPSPVTADLVAAITGGIARAARGKCLTAKREAGLTVDTINSIYSIKISAKILRTATHDRAAS